MRKKAEEQPTLNDLVNFGEMALGLVAGAWRDARGGERVARSLDLVTREEFDAAFAMLKKVRTAQADLEKRMTGLEKARQAKGHIKNKTNKKKTSRT